jgi:hypothetical protein
VSYSQITKLPKNLKTSTLNLHGTPITELPDNFSVDGLYLDYTKHLLKLPKNLICNILDISNSNISELPSDLIVTGQIQMTSTQISRLNIPKHLNSKIRVVQ